MAGRAQGALKLQKLREETWHFFQFAGSWRVNRKTVMSGLRRYKNEEDEWVKWGKVGGTEASTSCFVLDYGRPDLTNGFSKKKQK